jgi:hypothetical protein
MQTYGPLIGAHNLASMQAYKNTQTYGLPVDAENLASMQGYMNVQTINKFLFNVSMVHVSPWWIEESEERTNPLDLGLGLLRSCGREGRQGRGQMMSIRGAGGTSVCQNLDLRSGIGSALEIWWATPAPSLIMWSMPMPLTEMIVEQGWIENKFSEMNRGKHKLGINSMNPTESIVLQVKLEKLT